MHVHLCGGGAVGSVWPWDAEVASYVRVRSRTLSHRRRWTAAQLSQRPQPPARQARRVQALALARRPCRRRARGGLHVAASVRRRVWDRRRSCRRRVADRRSSHRHVQGCSRNGAAGLPVRGVVGRSMHADCAARAACECGKDEPQLLKEPAGVPAPEMM
eukprot:366018-Chlamydomonas_euryale.AAC.7